MKRVHYVLIAAVITIAGMSAQGRPPQPTASQASAFLGTWLFDMTEPPELVGSSETVRVFEKGGVLAATIQVGRFPPHDATGILRDGDLLVLTTTTMLENGAPIWAVVTLKRSGENMLLAQTMERSKTIKRGLGKKQAE
jgi:hypothetical protein